MNVGKICLRPLTEADLPTRAQWTADEELAVLMGAHLEDEPLPPREQLLNENLTWFAERLLDGALLYAIEADGCYIGDIDVTIDTHKRIAEITFWLGDKSQWSKGYGTEAAKLILAVLYSQYLIEIVEVNVAPLNTRALAFWERLGFQQYRKDERGCIHLRRQA